MNKNYLIKTSSGKIIYESIADLPIIDYHCHLSAKEIYEDAPYENIGELWLKYDHYKWRLMRSSYIEDEYITGNASWKEKFEKYIEALEFAAGNPLYHWTQMELDKYFNINIPIRAENKEILWEECNKFIMENKMSPIKLLETSNVEYVATTDDIADTLEYHNKIKQINKNIRITPSFRVDKLLLINDENYKKYIEKLSGISSVKINTFEDMLRAVNIRLEYFLEAGCKFADMGIEHFPSDVGEYNKAKETFENRLNNKNISSEDFNSYLGYMIVYLASLYKKNGMVMQWHLGVRRNVNNILYKRKGPDSGGDCIANSVNADDIIKILNKINDGEGIPNTVIYTLNPEDAAKAAVLAGSYNNIQTGPAWWFCDHKRGIRNQLEVIGETGSLGCFLGMLTDSRSFTSYARHDYFRRILADLLGEWTEDATYPDMDSAVRLAQKISYYNIKNVIENT